MYESAIALALRLIAKYGETSTLRRRVDGDSSRPWEPGTPTHTEYEVQAVWLDASFTGAEVKAGRQQVFIAASGVDITPDPSVDSLVRENGEVWGVESCSVLCPNGETIIFDVQVCQ